MDGRTAPGRRRAWYRAASILGAAVFMTSGCFGGDAKSAGSATSDGNDPGPTTTTEITVPKGSVDACALLTKSEVEAALGLPVAEPYLAVAMSMVPPGYSAVAAPGCEFRLLPPRDREGVVVRVANKSAKKVEDGLASSTTRLWTLEPTGLVENPGFEAGGAGQVAPGWHPYKADAVTECGAAGAGKCNLRVVAQPTAKEAEGKEDVVPPAAVSAPDLGVASQCVPGIDVQGKHVVVRAHLRAEELQGRAHVFASAIRRDDAEGRTRGYGTSSAVSGDTDWEPVEVGLDVARDADLLCIGAQVVGEGALRIDDVSVSTGVGDGPPLRWQREATTLWARKDKHTLSVQIAIREFDRDRSQVAATLARAVLGRLEQ